MPVRITDEDAFGKPELTGCQGDNAWRHQGEHAGAYLVCRRLQIPRRYRKDVAELLLKLGATPLDKSGVVVILQRTGDLELGREANQ